MSAKYFLDTNIFVYTFDSQAKDKNKAARKLIETALAENIGVISYQVIQEFLNVALRKFSKPLTVGDAKDYLKEILMPLCEVYPSELLYQSALTISQDSGYSFYDSLIVAAAAQANCKQLYSEDMQDGRKLLGLSIQNPFKK